MKSKALEFFWLLFDHSEVTCFAANAKGTKVFPNLAPGVSSEFQYFCINPLHANKDNNPTKSGDSRFKGRRADINVTAYRNILCEFDSEVLDQQMERISQIPHSTVVYSGGKSMHAIISLEEACKSLQEYKRLVKRVYDKLPTVDRSASNPSRLSRAPNALRTVEVDLKNGAVLKCVEQTLMYVGKRISRAELDAWLGPDTSEREEAFVSYGSADGKLPEWRKVLSPWCKTYLAFGSEPGKRNSDAFQFACELWRAGWSESDIFEAIERVADLPDAELRTCLRSAFANCRSSAHTG